MVSNFFLNCWCKDEIFRGWKLRGLWRALDSVFIQCEMLRNLREITHVKRLRVQRIVRNRCTILQITLREVFLWFFLFDTFLKVSAIFIW